MFPVPPRLMSALQAHVALYQLVPALYHVSQREWCHASCNGWQLHTGGIFATCNTSDYAWHGIVLTPLVVLCLQAVCTELAKVRRPACSASGG
jgi:hypothetical protein